MRAYGVRGAHWEAKIIFFKIKWFLGMTRCHRACVTPPCIQKSALAAICTNVGSWRPNHLFAGTLWISPASHRRRLMPSRVALGHPSPAAARRLFPQQAPELSLAAQESCLQGQKKSQCRPGIPMLVSGSLVASKIPWRPPCASR